MSLPPCSPGRARACGGCAGTCRAYVDELDLSIPTETVAPGTAAEEASQRPEPGWTDLTVRHALAAAHARLHGLGRDTAEANDGDGVRLFGARGDGLERLLHLCLGAGTEPSTENAMALYYVERAGQNLNRAVISFEIYTPAPSTRPTYIMHAVDEPHTPRARRPPTTTCSTSTPAMPFRLRGFWWLQLRLHVGLCPARHS